MAQYAKFIDHLPAFITCYDVESTKLRRWFLGNRTSFLAGLRQHLQMHAMRRFESSLGRLAHTVFATSELDREELQRMNGRGRFVCVPNGANLDTFTLRASRYF